MWAFSPHLKNQGIGCSVLQFRLVDFFVKRKVSVELLDVMFLGFGDWAVIPSP